MLDTAAVSAISIKFGQVLKILREQRSLSQEALSELSGISRNYLGELERGTSMPSLETLQKLADALQEKLSHIISLYEHHPDKSPHNY